jgi:hypothetical protein
MPDDQNVRYDEKWHWRVDRALFGHLDDASGVWVDGLLQSIADQRRFEVSIARVGMPLLIVIAVAVVLTALHQPPVLARTIGEFLKALF